MPSHRPLSEHDRAVWQDYVRQVRALKGRAPPPPAARPAPPQPAAAPQAQAPPPPRTAMPAPPLVTGLAPAGLDKSSWGRFCTGKLPAARTLDLHGKTAQAAFHALERFLAEASADHLRCVEIITGRGAGEQGGVIRRELPLWLNLPRLRPLILAAAHPHAQNPGSTRLLLRRSRRP